MGDTNLDIILLAGGGAVFVLLIVMIVLSNTLSKGRKETRAKLERFKARFDQKTILKGEGNRSIRVNQEQTGLAGMLSDLLPRRDGFEDLLADSQFGDVLDEFSRDGQRHIGLEQRDPHLAHRRGHILFAQAGGTAQLVEYAAQTIGQGIEHRLTISKYLRRHAPRRRGIHDFFATIRKSWMARLNRAMTGCQV